MNFKKLTYLCMQRLTNFPYIEEDFDALTNYELLCKVVEYLNKVIANENNQNEAIAELSTSLTELKNYVDNLDLQDEVNNKLDEMYENGQLADLVAQYLGLAGLITFDTVSDMRSAQNLVNGSKCATLGYHSVNDGGNAFYKVRTVTNDDVVDNMFIIELYDDSLVAELIISSSLNVDSLGAKGNGIDDDSLIIQKAINYSIENNIKLISSGNKNYLITSSLSINGIVDIDFNNSSIITNSAIKMININHSHLRKGGYIKNIIIDMNNIATHGIYCTVATKQLISNIEIINISNIGFELDDGVELIFENSHLRGSTTSNTSIGLKLNRGDSHYKDIIMVDCHTAIYNSGSNFFDRIHAWMLTPSLIKDSIFMEFNGTRSFLSQCYSDTYNIAFKITTDGRLRLVEHNNYYNPEILTSDIIATFTDGKIYFFYYTNDSYTRQTTITNSYLQGYAANNTLSDFSNVINVNNRMFIDSQTRVANWRDNFKSLNISVTTLATQYLTLSTTAKIRSLNNITSVTFILNNTAQINANNSISNIYTLESLLRPLQNEFFLAPVCSTNSYSTVYTYAMVWINTDGTINLTTPVNITANSYIYISRSFISTREP